MKRFVLWFITKYLSSSDIVDALLDRWPAKDQANFYLRGLFIKYRNSPADVREVILRALNDYNFHDTPLKPIHYEVMIKRILTTAQPFTSPSTLVNALVWDAQIGRNANLNYIKYNAYLTNVVRKTLGVLSTTDVQLIVALLKKRVENECE
ncbi:hypothetical protein PHABIO_270 [Pseudomonas phage Phabio]|uniref:Uncharacterized protein n=1 Tax=Pseudomonas phage Phabio TaxID=2006668 RepID=A0A1Y0STS9_9CAUD|nr:hypothetical protein MZD05_gp270 [Pseudomonas phage Phabio]ARV76901.1 hypothetical protein PHABIO_270 [Pseudomonas phage Phabio]